jgi:hypothetical protein
MNLYPWAIRKHVETLAAGLSMYTPNAWFMTTLAAAIGLAAIGLTTAIFENWFFVRMTPVRVQDYVIWILSSVLIGLIVGSYFVGSSTSGEGKFVSGGMLSVVAVGCPTCNKLVVLLLGSTGALTFFAPLQLYIGIASVLLLGSTLVLRTKALADTCTVNHVATMAKGDESLQSP